MNVLTHTSYKAHYDLYIEIHGSIAANSCQIRLTQKNIILLSKAPLITCKAGKPKGVENKNLIYSSLSAGTYSIDKFNAKIKKAILQQRQDWEPPQIKDLQLVIPEDYTFIASNIFFIALGIPNAYLNLNTQRLR